MAGDKIKIWRTCPKESLHDVGSSFSGADRFCWSCGSKLTEYTCECSDPACGYPASAASKFCTKCGKPTIKRTMDGKEFKREAAKV